MPLIILETCIKAPREIIFDLSRSLDLHRLSMDRYREEIIDGKQKGLMQRGDEVTWRARHFFSNRKLKVRMTELSAPHYFVDEMIKGDFKKLRHEHYFQPSGDGCLMLDKFYFESPFGILGKFMNLLFLEKYMKQLLQERNQVIKNIAEDGLLKQYLDNE